ncbi:MAG: glycosyltransferase family A protein [Patescibacteria group bacterium]
MMPDVSIVIPTFNRPGALQSAVKSVLDQTYQDFEIIVIDDGSSCDTSFIAKLDHRIALLKQRHQGAGSAKNAGIKLSQGKYIAFLDDDDTFLKNKLEFQISIMESNPGMMMSHTSYIKNDERQHKTIVNSGYFSGKVYPKILLNCPIATPTVMVNSKIFQNFTLKFPEQSIAEDLLLWTKISRYHDIFGIDKALSVVNVSSQSASENLKKKIIACDLKLDYIKNEDPSLLKMNRKINSSKKSLMGLLHSQKHLTMKGLKEFSIAFLLDPANIGNYYAINSVLKKRPPR